MATTTTYRRRRQSTTAKVTREAALHIAHYTMNWANGVIVRHRGCEYGVIDVEWAPKGQKVLFLTHEGLSIPARECTIRKGTVDTIATPDALLSFVA